MFKSAALAASFQLSKTPQDASLLYLYGRSLLGSQEHARAAHAFQGALALQKDDRGSFRRPFFLEDLRYHAALCHEQLGRFEDGLEVLMQGLALDLSSSFQRPRTLLLAARLMRGFPVSPSSPGAVIACYMKALELTQGTAVEAALGLLELGMSTQSLLLLGAVTDAIARWPWLQQTMEATGLFRGFRFAQALAQFTQLLERYPRNPFLLEHLAECHLQMSNIEAGRQAFDQLRLADPFATQGLDLYAMLVERHGRQGQGSLEELARHVHALRSPRAPQTWVALSVFWKAKSAKERALAMVEQALAVCPGYARAHLLKGQLLLDQNRPEEAKESFRLAKVFHPSFQAYRGLVACKFKLNDPKGAMHYATELKRLMYDSPRAITLYADLLLKFDPNKHAVAAELFAEALRIDPHCVEAVISMAALRASQQKHDEAIAFLSGKLGGTVSEADRGIIFFNLGKVYDAKGLFSEALLNYEEAQKALPGMKDIVDAIDLLKAKLQRNHDQPGSAIDPQTEPDEDDQSSAEWEEASAEGSYYV